MLRNLFFHSLENIKKEEYCLHHTMNFIWFRSLFVRIKHVIGSESKMKYFINTYKGK